MDTGANQNLVFIVAGEASADLHAAGLVDCLRKEKPSLQFFGVGSQKLRERGVDVLFPAEALSIFGVVGWWKDLRRLLAGLRDLKRAVRERKPVLAILLDLPDFNLLLARFLKKQGVPVVYYISPQVWVWRKYRVRTIRRVVSRMLVLFPFEKRLYDEAGVPCAFVGHPLLEQISARTDFRDSEVVRAHPRIAFLPGSRSKELEMHGQLLKSVAERLKTLYPTVEIRVPVAQTLEVSDVEAALGPHIRASRESSEAILKWADVALVASGTATLETALIGTPFALFYRVSAGNAWFYRNIMRYPGFIGMPNILLGSETIREFFQENATVGALVSEAERLISDASYRETIATRLGLCRGMLGTGNANEIAAGQVLEVLRDASATQSAGGVLTVAAEPA